MPVNSIIQRTLEKWGESLVKRVALGGGCTGTGRKTNQSGILKYLENFNMFIRKFVSVVLDLYVCNFRCLKVYYILLRKRISLFHCILLDTYDEYFKTPEICGTPP